MPPFVVDWKSLGQKILKTKKLLNILVEIGTSNRPLVKYVFIFVLFSDQFPVEVFFPGYDLLTMSWWLLSAYGFVMSKKEQEEMWDGISENIWLDVRWDWWQYPCLYSVDQKLNNIDFKERPLLQWVLNI